MSCQCGSGSPKPNNEEVLNYAPLGEAFKDNGINNYTKFEKLLMIAMLLLCFFLYQEIKV